MKKKIVILGGGYAGVLTAKNLAKKYKKASEVEITLIDKNPFHTMLTELHEVAACRVEENSIKVSLQKIFAGRNVNVVLDSISSIDYDNKKLVGSETSYDYDYLVISTGSKPTFFGIPGAAENTHKLWSYEDAVKLRNHMVDIFSSAALEPNKEKRKKMLSFFVVGAGFTGVEMVGELAEWLPNITTEYEIDPKEVSIYCVDILDRVVPVLPEKLSAKVHRRLEKMGVKLMLKAGVVEIGKDYLDAKIDGEVKRFEATTVIWSAGVEGTDISFKAGADSGQAAGRGRIQTDEFLRVAGKDNVFVGGDNIFFIPEGSKAPVPQMVENCESSSHTIAVNISAAIEGKKMESYKPSFHGVMVCVGGGYGVAHVGAGKFMIALPSFLAMFTKHFINIVYFIQLLGWNRVYSYVCHEFANVKNNRSFVGGHFSNRTPNFWMVPLRLWLGVVWIVSGVEKIGQGWLESPQLKGFFNGANKFYEGIVGPTVWGSDDIGGIIMRVFAEDGEEAEEAYEGGANAVSGASAAVDPAVNAATDAVTTATGAVYNAATTAGAAVTDAVTAATGAATGAIDKASQIIMNWDIFSFIKIILVNSGEVAIKVQVRFVDWMTNSFILSNDGTQMFMQVMIIALEIIIGLSLIAGLFTFLSASMSLVLQLMFVTTTGLYMSTWWMFFAGIAMLFGSGSVLGLDYYVLPWLKKRWKNVGFIRKWYLYND
jgi:NADH:ubiquinone reductase (H+-translocating)